jgi:hypothetical protein
LVNDESIITNTRKFTIELIDDTDQEDELSDYVRARLLIARLLALQAYERVTQGA